VRQRGRARPTEVPQVSSGTGSITSARPTPGPLSARERDRRQHPQLEGWPARRRHRRLRHERGGLPGRDGHLGRAFASETISRLHAHAAPGPVNVSPSTRYAPPSASNRGNPRATDRRRLSGGRQRAVVPAAFGRRVGGSGSWRVGIRARASRAPRGRRSRRTSRARRRASRTNRAVAVESGRAPSPRGDGPFPPTDSRD
jgi:hypothetical protein